MRIFVNTYKFANPHINKFILLLQKEVYPYEYIDDWEKFNETSLSEKDDFYTLLQTSKILLIQPINMQKSLSRL